MDGDRAFVESEAAVGVCLFGQFIRHIAVFDDLHLPFGLHEIPDLLQRPGLGDRLAAHLAAGQIVKAEEQRIDAVDEGVIDLEIRQVLDAPAAHVGQCAAARKRPETSAMPVGAESERVFLIQQQPAVGGKRRHHPLRKDKDIGGI